jgi:hypothetical protein
MESEVSAVNKMSNDELIDLMWQGLNKSSLKGVFNINESYLLKIVRDKLIEKVGSKQTPLSISE